MPENIPDSQATETSDGATHPTEVAASTEPTTEPMDLPDWAKDPATAAKMVADLRREAANARTSAKEAAAEEARNDLLKKLGLVQDDQPVDPAKAAQDIAAKDATIRDLTIKGALNDALHATGAKPLARAAILGEGILADLDHTAADFASTVAARVSEYVGKNPELRTVQAAAKSGVDTTGGNADSGRIYTRAQLRDHAFYQANKADIDLAAREGRIR